MDNLFKRKCARSHICPICCIHSETVEHMLFGCEWVRPVWFGSDLNLRISVGSMDSILKWSCTMMERFQTQIEREFLFCRVVWTGWFIWKERNNFVFNQHPIEHSSTLYRAPVAREEFESVPTARTAVISCPLADNSQRINSWVPPPPGG
ncbi:hypothetical protein LOK49_LG04G00590 [Camellia lanceoleosa]|uniref:Uncharacterized protein n=1 Tax=Camellia lanceoleosa TaxID=1840588 RepID=A0ACC0HUE4_9ERIC|nr:hypothetical protein LOK49_LG04G00590 [Camellia lanceoleosa]